MMAPRLQITRGLRSWTKTVPYALAPRLAAYFLQHPQYHPSEEAAAVQSLTAANLTSFAQAARATMFAEGLAAGNLLRGNATELAALIRSELSYRALADPNVLHPRVRSLPTGNALAYREPGPNPDEPNHATLNVYQFGKATVPLRAQLVLLQNVLRQRAFAQLRTQEQLGYVVQASLADVSGVLQMSVLVQSTVKPAHELDERIEATLGLVLSELQKMREQDVQSLADTIATDLLAPLNSQSVRGAPATRVVAHA